MTTSFRQHCEQKGIMLLRDDMLFIKDQLKRYRRDEHKAILSDYVNEWLLGMGNDTISQSRQNKGRFRANTMLRCLNK